MINFHGVIAIISVVSTLALGGQSVAGEPDFFHIDRHKRGPLTMEELQINIPAEVDQYLTEADRECVFATIERLAKEAGSPETVDMVEKGYLPADNNWADLTLNNKRIILAQAVVSHAFAQC